MANITWHWSTTTPTYRIMSSNDLFFTVNKPVYCFHIMEESLFFCDVLHNVVGYLSTLHLNPHCLHTNPDIRCNPSTQCVRQTAAGSNGPSLSEAEQCRRWPLFRCPKKEIKACDEDAPQAQPGHSPTVSHQHVRACVGARSVSAADIWLQLTLIRW